MGQDVGDSERKHGEEPEPTEVTFEEAFLALHEAVDQLEAGELPLDEALQVFERGMDLVRRCSEYLNQAELRVRQLQLGDDEEGDDETSGEPAGQSELPF